MKLESCHNANFVANGGTGGCHNDNLRYRQWRLSWHYDNSRVSVNVNIIKVDLYICNYGWCIGISILLKYIEYCTYVSIYYHYLFVLKLLSSCQSLRKIASRVSQNKMCMQCIFTYMYMHISSRHSKYYSGVTWVLMRFNSPQISDGYIFLRNGIIWPIFVYSMELWNSSCYMPL